MHTSPRYGTNSLYTFFPINLSPLVSMRYWQHICSLALLFLRLKLSRYETHNLRSSDVKCLQGIDFSKANNAGDRFTTVLSGTNGTLMAALVATFGIYLLSSLLYRDPWHMVTCLLQYLLLAPSFTNVLNTYAFCNL